ncbi:MAG: DUF1343 domain-containing protein, partial [Desulfobacterales bacterium]|nr:DUF1343 domain-containing protein [Desulfobacterales bacterium]
YPDFHFLRNGYFDNLAGTDKIRLAIQSGGSLEEIQNIWAVDLRAFALKKQQYSIYKLSHPY